MPGPATDQPVPGVPHSEPDSPHSEPDSPHCQPGAAAARASVQVGIHPHATTVDLERAQRRAELLDELVAELVREHSPRWVKVVSALCEGLADLDLWDLERVMRRVRAVTSADAPPPAG
jgi:hypothetical protein